MSKKTFLEPVQRQRLHETIASRLEEMILNGEFQPGESLPTENEMASQLEVSRTVVRDAIRVLATKGLVEIRREEIFRDPKCAELRDLDMDGICPDWAAELRLRSATIGGDGDT